VTSPTPLPAALLYGTVAWTVVGIAEDSNVDPDANPDAEQINGWATFTAQPATVVKGSPNPVTILPRPQRYQILNGRLVDKTGRLEVTLVANDSPGTTPRGWSYHVDFELNDGYTFGSFDFTLTSGQHVDLSDVQVLVEPEPGVVIVKGDAAHIVGVSAVTLPPGSAATAENVGTEFMADFVFGIPEGIQGDAATIEVVGTETLAPGSDASVVNEGTSGAAQLRFSVPAGRSATITPGATTTAPSGTPADVVNVGTDVDAVFDFLIPEGPIGPEGPQGPVGPSGAHATNAVEGTILLAGDLGGTWDSPQVPELENKVNTTDPRLSDARTPLAHDHDARYYTEAETDALLNGKISTTTRGAANGVATLDASAKIPAAQIPDIAVSEFLGVVANEAAMLALANGDRGDWVVRSDTGTNWMLVADNQALLASWRQLSYPAAPVASVAGRTGAVTLTSVDLTDSTAIGRAVVTAADAAGARGAIGAGVGNVTGVGVTRMEAITQAAHTALAVKDPTTLYVIVG
jgi:hypothetical protein